MKKILLSALCLMAVSQSFAQTPKLTKDLYLQQCSATIKQIPTTTPNYDQVKKSMTEACECIAGKLDYDKANAFVEKNDMKGFTTMASDVAISCAPKK